MEYSTCVAIQRRNMNQIVLAVTDMLWIYRMTREFLLTINNYHGYDLDDRRKLHSTTLVYQLLLEDISPYLSSNFRHLGSLHLHDTRPMSLLEIPVHPADYLLLPPRDGGMLSAKTFKDAASEIFLLGSLGVRGADDAAEEVQLALAKAYNEFGWKMYQELKNTEGNLIFSPLSVSSPLMLLWSATAGTTKEEISKALALPQEYDDTTLNNGFLGLEKGLKHEDENMTLTNAEGLISNQRLTPEFQRFLKDYEHVMVREMDISRNTEDTLHTINEFVANKTHNKIMKILDSLSPDATMILVDALYFAGQWLSKFDPKNSRQALFSTSSKSTVPMDTMYQKNTFSYVKETDYEALKMDYQGGMSMVVLLPTNVDGIGQLEESLPNFDWEDLDKKLESHSTLVKVTFPKFLLRSNLQLENALQKLGIHALFGEDADLSRMLGSSSSSVSQVVQKTFIKVGENGTEAAAATGIVSIQLSYEIEHGQVPEFVADHPFVFMLRHDKSKTNILIGRVAEPKEDS